MTHGLIVAIAQGLPPVEGTKRVSNGVPAEHRRLRTHDAVSSEMCNRSASELPVRMPLFDPCLSSFTLSFDGLFEYKILRSSPMLLAYSLSSLITLAQLPADSADLSAARSPSANLNCCPNRPPSLPPMFSPPQRSGAPTCVSPEARFHASTRPPCSKTCQSMLTSR